MTDANRSLKEKRDAVNLSLSQNQGTTQILHSETIKTQDGTESSFQEISSTFSGPRKFRYPLSMPISGKGYPGTITFKSIHIEPSLDVAASIGSSFDKASRLIQGEDTTSAEDLASKEISNQLLDERRRTSGIDKSSTVSYENHSSGVVVGKVILPLQRDLRFNDQVAYETANLGVIGAGLESALQGKNPFEGATNGDGTFTSAASALAAQAVAKASGVGVGAFVGKLAGGTLGGAVLGAGATEGLGDAVKSSTRIASAPNQRTLFKEVQLRQFAFTFKLIANSELEAEEIKQIVKFFRQELYPEKLVVGDNKIPFAYKFPNVFQIDIKNQYGLNPASKIQRCYLRDVQTVYNSTGAGLHTDGSFVEVDISLSFQEISALDKNMIKNEDY